MIDLGLDKKLLFEGFSERTADGNKDEDQSEECENCQGIYGPENASACVEGDVYQVVDKHSCPADGDHCPSDDVKCSLGEIFHQRGDRCADQA